MKRGDRNYPYHREESGCYYRPHRHFLKTTRDYYLKLYDQKFHELDEITNYQNSPRKKQIIRRVLCLLKKTTLWFKNV